jgi:hypothetical protein
MTPEEERRVREIVWEELSRFLGEIDRSCLEPVEEGGNTHTARGLLRRLFNTSLRRHKESMISSGIDDT